MLYGANVNYSLGISGFAALFSLWSFVSPAPAYAQTAPVINCQGRPVTSLDFMNPVLQSGTALQAGAVYRYSNVAPGVDSLVEITGFVNGGSLNTIDNDTGLVNYFQPELVTTGTSAVDFQISFVSNGTNTPVNLDFATSSIDVDGNNVLLREYVEFSDTSSGFVLNAGTQLDRNASGPTPATNRYEARTPDVAPGIDPTAENNIVTVFYTDTNTYNFRIGTLGTGIQTRLTSNGFDCPNLGSPVIQPEIDEDFGDALLSNYGNPIHTIVPGIRMGAANTAETSSSNSPSASGDSGDDGVIVPSFEQGETQTFDVSVTGSGGSLQSWFDWNNDGDFLDVGEQVAVNQQDDNNDGIIPLTVTAPSRAVIGETTARFRWSTASDVSFEEAAGDGEVEDYQFAVTAQPDFSGMICPSPLVVAAQSGNAETVIVAANNSPNALGALAPEGSAAAAVSAQNNNQARNLTLELADLVPAGAPITLSIARNNNNGNSDIDVSDNNSAYATQTVFNGGTVDVLTRITVTAPAGGVKFVRIQRNVGSTHIDGIAYDFACVSPPPPDLDANKTVAVYDPANAGLYSIPGNDVIYTITVVNAGAGPVDADTIEIIDALPPEVRFWNGDIDDNSGPETSPVAFTQTTGAGLTFDYATDVRFGTGSTIPADFDACTVIAPDESYREDLTSICLNPKGSLAAGDPDPEIAFSFRTQIK